MRAGFPYRTYFGRLPTKSLKTTNAVSSSLITPSVTTNRSGASNTGVAPFAVMFDASATTAAALTSVPFHELHYYIDFGDTGAGTWSYGNKASPSRNAAYGPISGHVFETPGTYTVTQWVYDPITLAVASTTTSITVTDPDTVFATTNTICIANGTTPVAGVNGVPTGATCVNTSSWATIVSYMTTGKRVLLKRGDSWTTPASSTSFNNAGPGILGAYGTGADPVIVIGTMDTHALDGGTSFQDWRFMNLEVQATALGATYGSNGVRFVSTNADFTSTAGKYTLALNVYGHHIGQVIPPGDDSIIANCRYDNIQGGAGNVGIFVANRSRLAILGTSVNDATLAEHCIRLQGVQKAVVSHCTLKDPKATDKHALTVRGWYGGTDTFSGTYTDQVILSDNEISGDSYALVHLDSENSTADERLKNVIFERNRVAIKTGYTYGQLLISTVESGLTIRNNLFDLTNVSEQAIIILNQSTAAPACTSAYIYNNSAYSAAPDGSIGADGRADTTGTIAFIRVNDGNAKPISGVVIKNNVAYTPSGNSPTFITTGGTVSYTASNNSSNGQMSSTSPSFAVTPPVTTANWTPSGYPVNAGTAVPVYDDFFFTARSGTMDMGAINV